jgi:PilZ domain
MGRRSEQRIAASLPILVRGIDSNGHPFTQSAQTHDISASGARIEGLVGISRPGTEFLIEYQGRKARFRVQWVGPVGTRIAGWVGVRCIDEGKYIWGLQLAASAPDEYDPRRTKSGVPAPGSPDAILANDSAGSAASAPASSPVPWAGNERRQFPRAACRIEAHVATGGTTLFLPATVTDICLGGCYLEMLSPFPLHSEVDLCLGSGDHMIRARGRVCSAFPGMGMGVSFTGMSPGDLRKLRRIAPPLADAQHSAPAESSAPSSRGGPAPPPSPRFNPEIVARTGTGSIASVANPPESGSRGSLPPGKGAAGDFAPSSHPQFPSTIAEALEAVVRVLLRKGILDQAELSAELQRLKAFRT